MKRKKGAQENGIEMAREIINANKNAKQFANDGMVLFAKHSALDGRARRALL